MKTDRLAIILDLIASEDIDSQEALAAKLNERGLAVTQATVSRDIKKLGLIKMRTQTGGFKYVAGAEPATSSSDEMKEGSPSQLVKRESNNKSFTIQDGVLPSSSKQTVLSTSMIDSTFSALYPTNSHVPFN